MTMTPDKKKSVKQAKALQIQVLSASGKATGTENLDARIAEAEHHSHLLYQYEVMYQANQRLGTAKAKDRSEVRGGGKKPWRQKGTGRARVGSTRSPLWRKGGTTFGPMPKDYGYELPKKLKKMALISGIKRKAQDSKLFMIEAFKVESGKTKDCAETLEKLRLKKPLIIRAEYDSATIRSARNIQGLRVTESRDVAAHDILASDECVMTRQGYKKILERLSGVKAESKETKK